MPPQQQPKQAPKPVVPQSSSTVTVDTANAQQDVTLPSETTSEVPAQSPPPNELYIEPPRPSSYAKSPDAGMLTITAENALQYKLCWSKPGNLPSLMSHLREKLITDAAGIYQAALDHGFSGLLMLTRDKRLMDAGDDTEPKTPDLARQLFIDDRANPLGAYGQNVTHMTMKDEFEAVARRKAAQENLRYGRV